MPSYSQKQIQQIWVNNGGRPSAAKVMSAIAMAESAGNSEALNDTPSTGDYSVGLWQINYFGTLRGPRTASYGSPEQLRADVNKQAKAAIAISGNGTSLSPWTTYTKGSYLQYMTGNASAVPHNQSTGGQPGGGNRPGQQFPEFQSSGTPWWAVGPLQPLGAISTTADVLKWLSDEGGLVRITEVAFGGLAIILGLVAILVDAASESQTIGEGLNLAALVNPEAKTLQVASRLHDQPKKTRAEAATNIGERKLDRKYGPDREKMGGGSEGDADFPEKAKIGGSSRPANRPGQKEATRRKSNQAAIRKAAGHVKRSTMEGAF